MSPDELAKARIRMEIVDGMPDGIRMLCNEYEPPLVFECAALAGSTDPEVVRPLLERNRRLTQEAVLRGDDPAYQKKEEVH